MIFFFFFLTGMVERNLLRVASAQVQNLRYPTVRVISRTENSFLTDG